MEKANWNIKCGSIVKEMHWLSLDKTINLETKLEILKTIKDAIAQEIETLVRLNATI